MGWFGSVSRMFPALIAEWSFPGKNVGSAWFSSYLNCEWLASLTHKPFLLNSGSIYGSLIWIRKAPAAGWWADRAVCISFSVSGFGSGPLLVHIMVKKWQSQPVLALWAMALPLQTDCWILCKLEDVKGGMWKRSKNTEEAQCRGKWNKWKVEFTSQVKQDNSTGDKCTAGNTKHLLAILEWEWKVRTYGHPLLQTLAEELRLHISFLNVEIT